VTDELEGI